MGVQRFIGLLRDLSTATVLTGLVLLLSLTSLWLITTLLRTDPETAVDFTVPVPEQSAIGWQGKTLARPSIKVPGSSAVQCYSPSTGQSLGLVNPVTPDGVDRAIANASAAQTAWSKTSFTERRRVLRTLLKFLLDNQETIARIACLDSGKTRVDALFGEILVTAEKLKWTVDHGERALKTSRRPTNWLMFYKKNEVRYEPLGVVAACVSWNYPFHNLIGPAISALFTGNACIIKNSEQTAWSSVYFAQVVRSALVACGHSPDLFHAITCWPATASYLAAHAGISHLTFIGSRPVAHEVAASAAKSLTPLVVELGGKDAAIILDDPNGKPASEGEIQRIASILMRGTFQSAGQNCVGIERIIAMPSAYSRLISMLAPRIAALRVGSDLSEDVDVGALISSASFSRLEALIAEAVAQGAKLLVGGHRHVHSSYPTAPYFEPTLLVDVQPTMRIAREELFAPICVFMHADTAARAVDIANDTEYGLGCSVFGPVSDSASRAQLKKVTREVKVGMVAVNDFAVTYAVQLPFGGTKGSGYGRFAGEEGLRGLCNIRSVCADRWPGMLTTSIPAKLSYPTQKGVSWEMGRGIVEVGYGEDWTRRLGGLRRMAGL